MRTIRIFGSNLEHLKGRPGTQESRRLPTLSRHILGSELVNPVEDIPRFESNLVLSFTLELATVEHTQNGSHANFGSQEIQTRGIEEGLQNTCGTDMFGGVEMTAHQ